LDELKEWMMESSTCSPITHFVCVRNPKEGRFRWVKSIKEDKVEDGVRTCEKCGKEW
jgi:hypothetical protein